MPIEEASAAEAAVASEASTVEKAPKDPKPVKVHVQRERGADGSLEDVEYTETKRTKVLTDSSAIELIRREIDQWKDELFTSRIPRPDLTGEIAEKLTAALRRDGLLKP